MYEYNFWDDRTWDADDFCPIINDICYNKACVSCDDYKAFEVYCNSKDGESNENKKNP